MSPFLKNSLIAISGFLLINLLAYTFSAQVDLTEDKRYSISPSTKELLENIDSPMHVTVYLASDQLPAAFERLRRATELELEEFKRLSGSRITYNFEDINAIKDEKEKVAKFDELINKGLQPTNILDTKAGQKTELLLFPYAIINDGQKETTVLLLKGNQGLTAQEKLNQSLENLEYELATGIRRLATIERKKIGLLTEFTSTPPVHFSGMINALNSNFNLFILDTKASKTFEGLDAIILAKPDIPVDDSTKYKIDQFIMHGGKALFFVDGLKVDSIGLNGTYAQPIDVNLNDLFFKYGLRINNDIVKDGLNFAFIPLVVGQMGDAPNIKAMPYRYYPLINDFGSSIITKNLDMVYCRFAASVDTLKTQNVRKTPLLVSSPYTKIITSPALITYNDARKETDQNEYQAGKKTIAYLLEGKFNSLFKNRFIEKDDYFKESSDSTKIFVAGDGDIVVNDLDDRGNPYPLGYDRFSNHQFANQDFLLNVINYMVDPQGLINTKAKSIKIRPLNKVKVNAERTRWQITNLLLPIIILVLFGFVIIRQYTKKYQ